MMRHTLLVSTLAFSIPALCNGQSIRKSQLATVSQMIGTARVEIVYRRPVARGRELFGELVPYGKLWSPSADSATVFWTTKDLQIAGSKLPAGRYSIWAIPDKEIWTVVFSSVTPAFHLKYTEGKDILRVRVKSHSGDRIESLAYYFPMVDGDSAVLAIHWGNTVVPMEIKASQ
ncbi:MAG: DUF2911 domain-containing protein [Gemmatimonadales bacterium]